MATKKTPQLIGNYSSGINLAYRIEQYLGERGFTKDHILSILERARPDAKRIEVYSLDDSDDTIYIERLGDNKYCWVLKRYSVTTHTYYSAEFTL